MLVLSRREVEELLDPDELVDWVARAMAALSAGEVSMPPRIAADVADAVPPGFLAAMPAHVPSLGALTTKLVAVFPGNAGRGLETHQAVVAAFDPETGVPVALMDGASVTERRTAAGSALSTRLLAREDASVLAILGTGVQARAHARAVSRVRPIREVRIAGRDEGRARALAEELSGELEAEVVPAASFAEAMSGADVVCAATHSPEPVIRREWVEPGMHLTSVGFNTAGREVDGETVRDSLLVVESREQALAPLPAGSNDVVWAIRDGLIGPDHVHAEIGELVAGTRPGRESENQISLYKSMGVAVQDAAAAALVLSKARERGLGREVDV
ncbi:MAG: ornithine cyclodeaminase family protein [Actinobacteria bacterium]|nr:ornithine cyclodeaminase family protein [Actinomycetota bacterium]